MKSHAFVSLDAAARASSWGQTLTGPANALAVPCRLGARAWRFRDASQERWLGKTTKPSSRRRKTATTSSSLIG
jgi:hypothetical protein